MMIRTRPLLALCALAVLVAACANAPAAPTSVPPTPPAPTATVPPTPAPTVTIALTPTPPPLGSQVLVAGVDLSGLDYDAARVQLETELAPLLRPLDIRAGDAQLTLHAEDIGLELSINGMLAAATRGSSVRVPLQLSYDPELLREQLQALRDDVRVPPVVDVITDTEYVSRSFVLRGGIDLDIGDAAELVDERLRAPGAPRRITLELTAGSAADVRPTPADLQEQLEAMADDWPGIAGIYVYDLTNEEQIGAINERTVFNAASTIKTAIMLNAYINLDSFSKAQEEALTKMIVDSDNLAANAMLSWAAGRPGTEGAVVGANEMSDTLSELGLENTYQYAPYEATDYIRLYNLKIRAGPTRAGEAPYTDTGRYLRTTPYEMGQIYRMIEECRLDTGILLDEFSALTPERCAEMVDRLEQNADTTRMMAGMPEGTTAAHKSGWINDMQADAGIVRSPGGDYVIAIYIYRELPAAGTAIPDRIMTATIAGFSRLVYSYYNPEVVEEP